jgi:type I restriction enzyme S subunit
MALSRYKLKYLIESVDIKNNDNEYHENDVRGITTSKIFISTKADLSDVKLCTYKMVPYRHFAYVPDTSRRGNKISLAFNISNKTYLVSSISSVFKVKNEKDVLSDYLFIYFNRPEFDRYSRFNSWGSAREVFSFDDLANMDIELPDITIQQKYVNIYNSLIQNQKVYERGLNDLKLTCDAYIERLRHELPLSPIGGYIEESDIRNSSLNASVETVRGITTAKEFIETKADMEGISLDGYKAVYPEYFAYVPDTSRRGDKISLAFNDSENIYLVSSISTVFKVKKLIPQYLFLFFRRDEFNRYTRFHSWGSVREVFTFDDMREVRIPVPDIKIQRDIVNIFNAYAVRKGISEKLKAHIRDMCPVLIRGAMEEGM